MTLHTNLRIDQDRLMGRIAALGEIGALPGGGVCRLALSEADRQGRDRGRRLDARIGGWRSRSIGWAT